MKLRPVPTVGRAPRPAPRAAPATRAAPSEVRGLVDNATAERLYGWAWDAAHPARRLRVELRLAGEAVASAVADQPRPDLAGNGVGDGRHAFEFPLDPAWLERRGELSVVAFGADGAEAPIAMRIRRAEDAQAAAQLRRAVEELAEEQRDLRAGLALLRERAAALPEAAAVAAIGAAQEELARKVQALELWLTRLDGRLGEAASAREARGEGRLDGWEAALIAVLAAAAAAALAVAAAFHWMA